jgi:BirA family biotin operon repressor/biotin-[acetyl-CoA-carboxylase] ligase
LTSNLPDELRASPGVPLDVQAELARVAHRRGAIGRQVHWLSTTSSTNDVAARLAERGAEEGTTVVAETQTAGRGRHGRTWFSPAGAGLYVSLVLRPAGDLARGNAAALVTLATGVALAEAVRALTGLPAEIKWPNDVVVGRRKLAGILAEGATLGGVLQHVVLGFGVNLRTAACPPELASRVTSIEAEISRPVERALVLAEILAALAERYASLKSGRFDAILAAWRRLAWALPAAPVEWDSPGGVVRGRAEDIGEDGALLVRVDGRIERVVAGEVRWM